MGTETRIGLLGIDVGTSGVKAVLCDETGRTSGQSTIEYTYQQPKPMFVEQDPAVWWDGTQRAIRQVLDQAGLNPGQIRGIGLTGQMHSLVLLDANHQVIRPAILWSDQRTQAEVDDIRDRIGVEETIRLTANPPLTNFTATKLLWVKKNEPENYARIAKVLLPKDYIRFQLTGDFASDVSDASGTLLFDVANRRWSKEMCEQLDVPMHWLPDVFESVEVTGTVSDTAARLTGLEAGTKVVAGGGDQAAGAVGNGIVKPGVVSSTIGTSGVVFAFAEDVVKDKAGRLHTFCHAVPGAWHVMGVTQAAGGSLQWYRNQFAEQEMAVAQATGQDTYEILSREANEVPAGSEGLLFLPYLMGERTPHLDPLARGVFFGISGRHQRGHFVRSIMEGVTFSLKDCLSLIQELGLPVEEIRVSGGGARSPLWRSIQADVFAQPVYAVQANEGPAFGAALLAGVGSGVFASVEEACEGLIHTDEGTKTSISRETYQAYYPLFQSLYASLKTSFQSLASVLEGGV